MSGPDTRANGRPWLWALLVVLCVLYGLLLCRPIILSLSDLGRHLTNGRLFLQTFSVPTTNFYSYTYPDFPFINHHWGTGVVFYIIYQAVDFIGLSLASIFLNILTFLLFFSVARKESSLAWATGTAVLFLPIMAARSEIRPEIFSAFFAGIFFWTLWEHRQRRIGGDMLIWLPFLQVLWCNMHIYFFFGPLLVLVFFLDAVVEYARGRTPALRRSIRDLLFLGLATGVALLAQPSGIRGAVYPLLIFGNYGYAVAENQSVSFMLQLVKDPTLYLYLLALAAFIGSWLYAGWRHWRNRTVPPVAFVLLSILIVYLSWSALRNLALFGFFALPIMAYNLRTLRLPAWWDRRPLLSAWTLLIIVVAGLGAWQWRHWNALARTMLLGVPPSMMDSIDFFKENNLKGPIFNNYDIGGYLTYGLYPRERVFVDNRPEAYPKEFFTQVLVPMQANEVTWDVEDPRHQFNVIYFSRLDRTTWGQNFLVRRVFDPDWAAVHVDPWTIILVRRTPENAEVIEKYELPQSIFRAAERTEF